MPTKKELTDQNTRLLLDLGASESAIELAQSRQKQAEDLIQRYEEMAQEARARELALIEKISKAKQALRSGDFSKALEILD